VLVKYLPEGEFFYDEDTLTDKPEKFFAAEIIRDKILSLYHDEIPYSVMVSIQEFAERSEKLVYINAEIIVERESQKAVIIGRKGESLKKMGALARKSLEHFLGKKVYLELFVKVRKGWRNNRSFVRESLLRNNPS
jgi:GTP-binding protein Era